MIKTAFQLSRGACFLKNFPFEKIRSSFEIWSWSKTDLIVLRKLFDSSSKIANYVSKETFWRKNNSFLIQIFFFSFGDFEWDIFNFSGKITFHQFCQNCVQRIQRNDLMKILPFRKLEFYTSLRLWLKSFLTSCWKTSARLSKLYLRVQSTFRRTVFFC